MDFRKKFIGLSKKVGIVKVSEKDKSLSVSYINIGQKYLKSKNYQLALQSFINAINLDPNNFQSYYCKAKTNFEQKKYDNALVDFNKSIELNPEFADSYFLRGFCKYNISYNSEFNIKYFPSSRYSYANDAALDDIVLASELEPDNLFYLNKRAIFYNLVHKHDLALKDLNRLILLKPNEGELYKRRGDIKHKLYITKDSTEYCDDWEKALELGFEEAFESLQRYCDRY